MIGVAAKAFFPPSAQFFITNARVRLPVIRKANAISSFAKPTVAFQIILDASLLRVELADASPYNGPRSSLVSYDAEIKVSSLVPFRILLVLSATSPSIFYEKGISLLYPSRMAAARLL